MEQDRDEEQKKLKALWRVPFHFPFFFFFYLFFFESIERAVI